MTQLKKGSTFPQEFVYVYFWYRCFYPHRSRELVSPECGIFLIMKIFVLRHSKSQNLQDHHSQINFSCNTHNRSYNNQSCIVFSNQKKQDLIQDNWFITGSRSPFKLSFFTISFVVFLVFLPLHHLHSRSMKV